MLPELSGLDVCRVIRRDSEVPILMLTAKDSELDRVVGLELGANDYLTKPFSLRELQARIRALLRRTEEVVARSQPQSHDAASATEPAVEERLGSVVVDLAGHRLVRDGAELPVTARAFDLLVFLMRHPGQVFTREQLLERVWGYEHPVDTRTVDTGTVDMHIHKLRRVIADDLAVPRFLHTVRTVGYVFRRPL
jgi:DNA-binding response OmpR family regulator